MKILIGIPIKNTAQYLPNLFEQLLQLDYDLSKLTLVLLESDSVDNSYQVCCDFQQHNTQFGNVFVEQLNFRYNLSHNSERYHQTKFIQRIKNLIVTRNHIVDTYLQDNDCLWWVDSDFEIIPPPTIQQFLSYNKDVIIPKLTHNTWKYHDCGSVFFDNGQQKRFQFVDQELVKLDRADTHCFIQRRVFDANIRYTHIDKPYHDGCGGQQLCYSDGIQFSFDCIAQGFGVYGANQIVIQHHDV